MPYAAHTKVPIAKTKTDIEELLAVVVHAANIQNRDGAKLVLVKLLGLLINDDKECVRAASPENVTETLAPEICPNQRHFRQHVRFCEGLSSPGVNQFFGHDAAPLSHPALQGSQLRLVKTVRMLRLQPDHQRLAGSIRFGLQPDQHVTPNAPEGILSGPPVPGASDTDRVSGPDLTLPP